MKLFRTAALGAAMATVGLLLTAPSASAGTISTMAEFPVAPGETMHFTQNCPASTPYLARTGFRVEYTTGVDGVKKIRRNSDGDGWTVSATNSGTETGWVTVRYTCSSNPTTINKENAAMVRSSDPKPLETSITCPSGYPTIDSGSYKYPDRNTANFFTSFDVEAPAGVQMVYPDRGGSRLQLTLTSSYPPNTNPPRNEYIKFNWVCAQ
ncbi:hypothetical protein [Acrocarpospora catenulata]|uniref:hypothetical protein n=1 Tax=Acrocarpospora catenulata TaxID=2836182 RepID=UPI001BDAADE2|nr:hypothetical protein [Acrocarpospora catenulata]